MEPLTFGEFVTQNLAEYRAAALAKDPHWFDSELNQRALLDFQMQVMAMWIAEQQRATPAPRKVN